MVTKCCIVVSDITHTEPRGSVVHLVLKTSLEMSEYFTDFSKHIAALKKTINKQQDRILA